jgi:hypothetical protein
MVVYDFLYTNTPKITSFYAQIFEGLLTKNSRMTSTESQEAKAKGVGYSKTYGESRSFSAVREQMVEEVDPREIVIIDTLATLSRSAKEISEARNGELVTIRGDMFLMDKALFDLMMPNIGDFMMMDAPKNRHKEIKKMAALMRKLFESIRFDPIVFTSMAKGVAVGNIREEFLSESITSFQLKHGKDGVSDVTILGIKEEGSMEISTPDEGLINGAMDLSDVIKNLIIPEEAVLFTPLAIYREIPLYDEAK